MFRRFKKIITKIALLAMIFSIFPQNVVKVHADPAPIDESSVPPAVTLSYGPDGIAVDSSNNIYAAGYDYSHQKSCFSEISPDGTTLNNYTGFDDPYGVAIDNSGNIYITEPGKENDVKKMSPDGTILNTYTGFNFPYGVAVDNDGNLYVANKAGNTIQKVSKSGELLKTYSDLNLNSPYGIALDSSNNIYVADYMNSQVKKVSSEDGTIIHTYDVLGPCGVAIDSDNNIYIAEKDAGCVEKLSQDGIVLAEYTNCGDSLRGIALDKDKNIYVSDNINSCIKKIETQGVEITGFDAIGNVSAGNAGNTTYANATAVIAALPKTVKANNGAVAVPVSKWVDTDHYNPNAAGSYTFTATLGTMPAGYKNTGNYKATVEVVVSPAPAPVSIQVSVTKLNPTAGNDERITLTAKDLHGNTDTQFNDLKNVTVSGYKAAPDGSYGNFAQCDPTAPSDVPVIGLANLKADSTTLGFYFEQGVACANLALNDAAAQNIVFTVEGVDTPTTEPSTITPVPAAATSMSLTQDITAPASNGGQFVKQPKVTLKDKYLNICTNDNSTQVTVSKKDTGTWTLTGTAAVAAKAGIVNFTDLGASNSAAVTGAQLAFNAANCTQITSSLVNLPAPSELTRAATPTASPTSGGSVDIGTKVSLSTETDGAVIYYTTDLSDPTTSSTRYTGAITINKPTTIKAIAAKDGMANSDVLTANYNVNTPSSAATPTASPAGGGSVDIGTTVSLSTETDGAAIYYTTDLSAPTTASTRYTGPITINKPTTIKAIAAKDGMANSDVLIASYNVNTPPSGDSFSIQVTGKPVETVNKLDVTPNMTGGYHFKLPNETRDALLNDVNSVNADKVTVTISKLLKSISGEFPKTNITNENLTTGVVLPVTTLSSIIAGGNTITSGRYNVRIKMTPGSTESDFDLTFEKIAIYTLTYTAGAGGTLTGTATQIVDQGASGTAVTAVANSGYHFVSWSDGNTNATRTDSNVTANKTVTASFEINAPTPVPTPTETTTGTVVDPTTGKTVQGIETKVATETDGTKTVAVKSQQAIVLKTPDGNINPLTNISRLGFSSGENSNVTIASDGTIKIKNLSKGTEEKINVTIDLGNGQKVIIGSIDVKVSKNGDVSLTSSLIDPYGIITDSTTGKAINGANVTLYYANTDRNKSAGKTPDTAVQLPEIADFKPNSNKNPQVSDLTGAYGFMVYPTTDYYIVATKDGYNKYTSPTISVEQEIVKFDFSMNKIQDSTINPVTAEFDKNTSKQADLSITMSLNGNTLTSIINGTKTLVNGTDYEIKDNVVTIKKSYLSQQSTGTSTFSFNFSTGNVQALAVTVKDTTSTSSGGSSGGSSGSSSGTASTPAKATVERIAGQNRVDTAIAIAKATYKDKVSKVILAASDNFPDALAGSVLAYNSKAPILLVGSSSEDQQKVVDYIKTNMDSTGIVYILGGTGGVGKDMETKVISNGFKNVTRIGGADRYETAAKISDTLGVKQGTPVVIVSGENYADAVSVSSIAARNQYPILMVRKDEMPEIIKKKLSVIKPNKIYVIGLEGSVSKEVENEAVKAAAIDNTNVTRIGGVNRFETSLDVAKYFNLSGNRVCIASGNNFPDALAGSSYASENNAPIMLVDENLSDNEISYLKNSKLSGVTIFGGESVVGKNIQQQISQIIGK